MKARYLILAALIAALTLTVAAQQGDPGQQPGGNGGGRGMRMGQGMMGQGVVGTVTDVASDHYTVKTTEGETYTIQFSANTRIMKQAPAPAGQQRGQNGGQGQEGGGFNRTPPTPIKASDIKVGDVIMARGEVAPGTKSVGAMFIVQVYPESAKRMQEMEASFGKTWLAGLITAIDGTKVTIQGGPNHGTYTFVADENTEFRSRREPITLADLKVGAAVRVQGAIKDGQFVASNVNLMMVRAMGGPAPREGSAPPQ